MKGFTLLEVLLVLIIIGIIIGFSSYWYGQINQKSFLLDETASFLITVLNIAKQKSIVAEENDYWGVWLVNNQTGPDFVYLFKSSTTNIRENFELPLQINFEIPPVNSSAVVIFKKINGETTSTYLKIISKKSSIVKYIIISTSSPIYATSSLP